MSLIRTLLYDATPLEIHASARTFRSEEYRDPKPPKKPKIEKPKAHDHMLKKKADNIKQIKAAIAAGHITQRAIKKETRICLATVSIRIKQLIGTGEIEELSERAICTSGAKAAQYKLGKGNQS